MSTERPGSGSGASAEATTGVLPEDLLAFALDPTLGEPWPAGGGEGAELRPAWRPGQTWRVELTLRAPALGPDLLGLGSELRAVLRYRVLAEEKDAAAGGETVFRVRVEREGAGAGASGAAARGTHLIATYRASDLALVSLRRFVAGEERAVRALPRLPRLTFKSEVVRDATGVALVREHALEVPRAP